MAPVTVKSFCRDAQSRWPELASDSQFIKQSGSHQQASHCKAAGASADVKSPILQRVDRSHEACPPASCADSDGAGPPMRLPPAPSLLPIARSSVPFQSLTQSSIQSLPLTEAHLACRWTEERKKESQCVSVPARLGKLGDSWLRYQPALGMKHKSESCQWFHSG